MFGLALFFVGLAFAVLGMTDKYLPLWSRRYVERCAFPFAGICFILSLIFLGISFHQNYILHSSFSRPLALRWPITDRPAPATAPGAGAVQIPHTPTFQKAIKVNGPITVAFGGMQYHTFGMPMLINGRIPFSLEYGEGGRLICNVSIYAIGTNQTIIIRQNRIENLPDGWDANSNDNGVEVVNEKQRPVFQMYYESPTVIRIQGIIIVPPLVMLAKGDNLEQIGFDNPALPDAISTFSLPRFFKYPSAMFPGVPD